jgi:hypothetical protein
LGAPQLSESHKLQALSMIDDLSPPLMDFMYEYGSYISAVWPLSESVQLTIGPGRDLAAAAGFFPSLWFCVAFPGPRISSSHSGRVRHGLFLLCLDPASIFSRRFLGKLRFKLLSKLWFRGKVYRVGDLRGWSSIGRRNRANTTEHTAN